MSLNRAAYLVGKKSPPLVVKSAPYTSPGPNEVVVKNHAVAVNPIDNILPVQADLAYPWLKYPAILGEDVAGEVVEVGKGVTRFKVGDRVVSNAIGLKQSYNSPAHGGFQLYSVLLTSMTSHIPDSLSYEKACVLPLGLSTAACALFQKDQLGLQHPSVPPAKPTGKTLLVWGGSTSVGSNAIQLAVAAGYEVIATASPRNFDYARRLGAKHVFDYHSATVVQDIKKAFQGQAIAGAISMGHGAADACLDVLAACTGDKNLAMATYPLPATPPKRFVMLQTAYAYLTGIITLWIKAKRHGIQHRFIFGDTLVDNEVGPMIYEEYLPRALAAGELVAAPEPEVVGHGLEEVQRACDELKKGVSAKKMVVTL